MDTMEEMKEKKGRKFSKDGVKLYFTLMGVFCGIALVVILIMLKQFRHLWVECVNEPITTYSVVDTDMEWTDIETEDIKGNKRKEAEDTYFLMVKYNGSIYRVEASESAYERAYDKKIKDYATGEGAPSLYYDKLIDDVFEGWFHPDYFYVAVVVFIVVLGIFIYVPIKGLISSGDGGEDKVNKLQ